MFCVLRLRIAVCDELKEGMAGGAWEVSQPPTDVILLSKPADIGTEGVAICRREHGNQASKHLRAG